MEQWTVGEVRVSKLVDLVSDPVPAFWLFPGFELDALRMDSSWLWPTYLDDDGNMVLSFHAFGIESDGVRILVDTCVGGAKQRPADEHGIDWFHERESEFLTHATEAGFGPDEVDVVLCTHLHFDHVGWNTRLVDGEWVPTFPGARYLVSRLDLEHWSDPASEASHHRAYQDSVRPIVEAGLAGPVEPPHEVAPEVRVVPTPGHTPGHVSVQIVSAGEEAVITGDVVHHPCQLARPDWASTADGVPGEAEATRRRLLADVERSGALLLGTHFVAPTAGRLRGERDGWRLDS